MCGKSFFWCANSKPLSKKRAATYTLKMALQTLQEIETKIPTCKFTKKDSTKNLLPLPSAFCTQLLPSITLKRHSSLDKSFISFFAQSHCYPLSLIKQHTNLFSKRKLHSFSVSLPLLSPLFHQTSHGLHHQHILISFQVVTH